MAFLPGPEAVHASSGRHWFKAVNSRDRNFTPMKIDRRIEQIEASVRAAMARLSTLSEEQNGGFQHQSFTL